MAHSANIGKIAGALDEILLIAAERCTVGLGTYQLGLRLVTLMADGAVPHAPREGALVRQKGGSRGHHLYLLSSNDLPELSHLNSLALGAYGFARELQAAGWLVTLDRRRSSLVALHRESRQGFFISKKEIAARHHAEFLRGVAHWHAILDGNLLLHAGAVSRGGRVVLLLGKGGSGKTSLVLRCASSGWQFLGDNVVEIKQEQSGVLAGLVYPTAKVRAGSSQFSHLGEGSLDPENGKYVYFLGKSGIRLGSGSPQPVGYCALLTPETEQEKRLVSAADLLLLSGPDTIAQFPGFERELLARINNLMTRMPVELLPRAPLEELESSLLSSLEKQS